MNTSKPRFQAIPIAWELLNGVPHTENGEQFVMWVLWNKTGFPMWFLGEPEDCLRKQITAFIGDSTPAARYAEWRGAE